MSHRKFEAPRHGHLGFLPKKRCTRGRGKIKAFPRDKGGPYRPKLTGFMGFKAGCTHVIREVERPGSKLHNKETSDQVTLLEAPPMTLVGLTGYVKTPKGLRPLKTIWAKHVSEGFKRRIVRSFAKRGKKTKAYSQLAERYGNKEVLDKLKRSIIKHCSSVRAICHTQMVVNGKRRIKAIQMKKDPIMEFQINGGTIADKVAWAMGKFEKEIRVTDVFKNGEMMDIVGITKGKGFKGVTSRWHTKKLPRKTHKGLRKVACIGAWHPARIQYSVARAGQKGYHHRTERNFKIFRIGKKEDAKSSGMTESDITAKPINPMGGWPNYGIIKDDFVMVRGSCMGPKRRLVTMRQSLVSKAASRGAMENIHLKLIDTTSVSGKGRFQTSQEKRDYMGPLKKQRTVIIRKKQEAEEAKSTARKA